MEKENFDSTFYNPAWHQIDDNGTLHVKASGYSGDFHWTGTLTVEPTQPDYALWMWIISEKNTRALINDQEFARLKREFADKQS